MSAEVEALDRGLADVGLTAAEALALAKDLEKRVAEMEQFFAVLRGSRPSAAQRPARKAAGPSSGGHLQLVQGDARAIFYCPVCGAGSSTGSCPRGCGGMS